VFLKCSQSSAQETNYNLYVLGVQLKNTITNLRETTKSSLTSFHVSGTHYKETKGKKDLVHEGGVWGCVCGKSEVGVYHALIYQATL